MKNRMEPFTVLDSDGKDRAFHLFDEMVRLESGISADHDLQYVTALREQYPEMIVTAVPQVNANIIAFAAAGFAEIELDTDSDSYASWKGYVRPQTRSAKGALGEYTQFAKYHLQWKNEDFIMYLVQIGFSAAQYLIKERGKSEKTYGPSKISNDLIFTVGEWQNSDNEVIWIFDQYWRQDRNLYKQVKKASWDKVILDEKMKKDLTQVSGTFFDSKKVYDDLGVPWKRGLLFHGPPGNGKTISIKALMNTLLFKRSKDPIPTLYVKSAPYPFHIGAVFQQARILAPCMLVLEDIETIVTSLTRSYFFNELDGLDSNNGIFVVATTNYLERLDPGLTKRPSRFDRKYLFPMPNLHERELYCQFWQKKLESNESIEFPDILCPAMASATPGFSFAFMQECFVATMLSIARHHQDDDKEDARYGDDHDDGESCDIAPADDLEKYEIWREFKVQAKLLRKQIDDEDIMRKNCRRDMVQEPIVAMPVPDAPQPMGAGMPSNMPMRPAAGGEFARGFLPFNFHKQPEINTAVWNWVGPRQ